jgi:predicted dehydrogenase
MLGGVCSRELVRAKEFARAFVGARAHASIDDLARSDEIDVVYVATPHVRHRDDSLACLAAGKPVLCEKPFTLSARQAAEVIAQSRARNLFCMEAMWMRFHPLILRVRSLIESGAIGQPRLVVADFGCPTHYDPSGRFFSRALGGGALLDRGVYLISLAFFLLGRPHDAIGRATIGPTGVDEQMSALLQHSEGALAVLTASLRNRLRNEALVMGTGGQIRIHEPFFAPRRVSLASLADPAGPSRPRRADHPGWLRWIKRRPLLRRAFEQVGRPILGLLRKRESGLVHDFAGNGYQFEADEVMRCLREGERESPLLTLDETQAVLQTMDGLREQWRLSYPGEEF